MFLMEKLCEYWVEWTANMKPDSSCFTYNKFYETKENNQNKQGLKRMLFNRTHTI